MNQVRSDQLSLTFFLLLISFQAQEFPAKKWLQLGIAFLFPLIAFKSIYFSILSFFLLPWRNYMSYFQEIKIVRKCIIILVLANFAVWGLYHAASALHYFLESDGAELSKVSLLLPWARTEWFYIYFSFLPYLFKDFRSYQAEKKLEFLFPVQVVIIGILIFHPQKLAFFIASFLPILYLTSVVFCQYLNERKIVAFKFVFSVLLLAGLYSIYSAQKYYHVFTLNNPQLVTIDRIANIITKNSMTYLDGMGILPRAKNIGCFISPDDHLATQFCVESLRRKSADAIIITNRLMSLGYNLIDMDKEGYTTIGPNLLIKSSLVDEFTNRNLQWPAPSLIFSFEQLY